MGGSNSNLAEIDESSEGYHVLRVQDNSPGKIAGMESFFDFILAIDQTRLNQDNDSLKSMLQANLNKETKLTVYSSKTQTIRVITVIPRNDWGGQGLLGVSIRFCSFKGANENVWHVLEVHPSSPAEISGLRPFTDYIIGADSILHESEDLFTLIETHEDRSLKLYVYNTETDSCREVNIIPNSRWGGVEKPNAGMLGCEIGFGYLHRIPLKNGASATTKPSDVIQSYFTENRTLEATTKTDQSSPVIPTIEPTPSIPTALPTPTAAAVPPVCTEHTTINFSNDIENAQNNQNEATISPTAPPIDASHYFNTTSSASESAAFPPSTM
ncbi:Golgi reassembly-stacking protein 2 isoform X2 [Culicoides brevitarsis]|uniref:Golgi reassembly-stacking protein 2 isoform X2 n=1 Tax=Culicoides brevitarsis TaxID=469753 RepID=UPI00307B253A